jgi:hypothetical protein
MNLKICFALLSIGILVGAILYFLRKNNLGRSGTIVGAAVKSGQVDADKLNWLNENIRSFKKNYCGFLIENERIDKGYSINQLKELQDKYGVVLSKPVFSLSVDFYEKYPNETRSVLMNLIRQWLKNSGKLNVETDNLLDAIENRAIEEASEEFKQVFKSFDFSQKCD